MLAPSPHASGHDQAYWDAAREGRLLLQRCSKTGRHQFYPRSHSLATGGADIHWVGSPGLGTVHTFTVVHKSFYENIPAPFILAMVDLDEGVRVTAHIVEVAPEQVQIGLRVKASFIARGDGLPLLVFREA